MEGALRHYTCGLHLQKPPQKEKFKEESTMERAYRHGLEKLLKSDHHEWMKSSWNDSLLEIETFHSVNGNNVEYTCCDLLLLSLNQGSHVNEQDTVLSSSPPSPSPVRVTQYYFAFVVDGGQRMIRYMLSSGDNVLISIKGKYMDPYYNLFIPKFEELRKQTEIGSKLTSTQLLDILLVAAGMTDGSDKILQIYKKEMTVYENLLKKEEELRAKLEAEQKEQALADQNNETNEEEGDEEDEEEDDESEEEKEEDDSIKVK